MGAWIGARSHEEIAVSVVSELIAVRRTGSDLSRTWEQKPKRRAARGMMTVLGEHAGDGPEAATDGADGAVAGAG
jgi:xanthine/CO dehydrogenase XdhC/CoxF family maturation factor